MDKVKILASSAMGHWNAWGPNAVSFQTGGYAYYIPDVTPLASKGGILSHITEEKSAIHQPQRVEGDRATSYKSARSNWKNRHISAATDVMLIS